MSTHPAAEFLLAHLSFTLTQLSELHQICELANSYIHDNGLKSGPAHERIANYQAIFKARISELEAQLHHE